MARELRDYSGGAVDTTITGGISSTDLSITLADATGWPTGGANGPFFVIVSYDVAGKEKIEVASRTGTTLTVANTGKRGIDGTSATSHASGAKIRHCITAQDHDEFNSHAFDTTQDDHTQYLNVTRHDITGRHSVGSVIPAAVPGTIAPDDTANAGVANSVARSDHRHAITAAAAGTIQPDDTAAEGVATSFARSDHRHAIVGATASTITHSNQEGSATSFARSDHNHAYGAGSVPVSALNASVPRGIVARQTLTANSSGFTASGSTDMTVGFTADVTRLYKIKVHSPWSLSGSGRWLVVVSDGAAFHRLGDISDEEGVSDVLESSVLWEPTAGAKTLVVDISEISGTSTLTFIADPTFPRQLWVEDIGPR